MNRIESIWYFLGEEMYLNLQNVVCQVWGKKSDPKANNVISPDCVSSPGDCCQFNQDDFNPCSEYLFGTYLFFFNFGIAT